MHADNDERIVGDEATTAVAVEIFSLLADATRLNILIALQDGELPVGVIADQVGKSGAAVSQHLAKLRMSRVVSTRHEGVRVFYRLSNEHAIDLIRLAFFQAEHALDSPVTHIDRDPNRA
ncbi:ArsR/SmtB family transcription factor [Humidisolicoccus flavus]|uniref:ArsR/SmtB family transcription factor n=1 Tax=Humidisolicoccus flavus TaxID=3111414 RepID=UPI00325396CE